MNIDIDIMDINNNKAILLMNSTSSIGGAQKRYLNLFNYIISVRDDYYLIINKLIYDEFRENNLLTSDKNVRIIDLRFDKNIKKKIIKNNNNDENNTFGRKKKFKKLRRIIWLLRKFKTWLSFAIRFRYIQKNDNIKIVYSVWMGGIWVWPLKYFFNFKLIHSYNDSSLSSLSRNVFNIFSSEIYVLKHCDKIDFLSAEIITRLEEKIGKINRSRINVSPNSFVLYDNYFPEYPKENSVIFMSRLTDIKNPLLFVESIKIYNEKYRRDDVHFYILGVGLLENEIKDYIAQYKLSDAHFNGAVYEPWQYLRTSRIFVSLQRDDNYPSQSVLEAMACENAIIASDVGETRKLVTNNEGILVNLNAGEIAEAMNKLISNPKLIKKLGKNARKKAMAEHNIEKYSEYFYKITSGGS